LSATVIDGNPANYTAWHYRRQCLKALNKNLKDELKWVADVAFESPKNYQLWHHRRVLVEIIDELGDELPVTTEILKKDPKNYHVWVHRQWILKKFKCFETELDFVDSLLQDDLRNNSAWNQRHFAVEQTSGFSSAIIDREIKYTHGYLVKAINNESPWNYLIGLLDKKDINEKHMQNLETFALEVIHKDSYCAQAYSFLIELYDKSNNPAKAKAAVEYCEKLSRQVDTIRHLYWDYRRDEFLAKITDKDIKENKYENKSDKNIKISLSSESRRKDQQITPTSMSSISNTNMSSSLSSSLSSSSSDLSMSQSNQTKSSFSVTTLGLIILVPLVLVFWNKFGK